MKLEASVRFLNDCIVRHRQLSTQVRQHLLQRGEQAWEVIPNRISQHFMIHPIIAMRHDVPQPGSTPPVMLRVLFSQLAWQTLDGFPRISKQRSKAIRRTQSSRSVSRFVAWQRD